MSCRPFEDLGYAIILQAVEDMVALEEAGIVKNGVCVKDWPIDGAGIPVRILGHYNSPAKVDELVHFLNGDGAAGLLDLLGSSIDPNSIKKAFGLIRGHLREKSA